MTDFYFRDGEAFLDDLPVKELMERAQRRGWIKKPTLTVQEQQEIRALSEQIPDEDDDPGRQTGASGQH